MKTTTLLQLLELCQYKTLFLAFNKSVQEEIQSKIDERGLTQGKALTMHSLGLSAVRSSYRKVSINNGKNFDLIKKLQENNRNLFRRMSWEDKLKLSYCLMDMNDISRLFLTDDIEEIHKQFLTMDKVMSDLNSLPTLWTQFLELRNATYQGDAIEVDFNDMIYLPVIKDLSIPIDPYYLFMDEVQDFNICQHKIIDKLLQQSVQKFIAVGDRNQSIYGFSGAYSSSFDLFLDKGNVVELPLDICYRCSTKIIDIANEVYDVMEYSTENPGIVGFTSNSADIKDNSMVICRNSGPLVGLYFQLLALGKPCYIKGEDILTSIVRFLKPYNNYTTMSAKVEMSYKMEELSEDTSDEGKMQLYFFKENFNNFKKISEHMCEEYETIDSLVNKLK